MNQSGCPHHSEIVLYTMTLRKIDPKKLPSIDIDLSAPPKERWKHAADMIWEEVHSVYALYDDVLDDQLAQLPWYICALSGFVFSGIASFLRFFNKQIELEYSEELAGFAKAFDLPFDRLLSANLVYDILLAMEERPPCACSSFTCIGKGGGMLVGRNLDWAWPEGLGEYTMVTRFWRRKHSYTSIGFPGYLGVLTAFRRGHWSVNLNQAPRGEKQFNLYGKPVGQYIRSVCDHSITYKSLVKNLQEYQTFQPYYAHVVGTEQKEQVVINGFGESYSIRKPSPDEDFLVQTNHYPDEEFSSLNLEKWEQAGEEWVSDSTPRFNTLSRRLRRGQPGSLRDCLSFLKAPVASVNTCQSIGINVTTGDWEIRTDR